jgi:hypothetical protein
MARRERRRAVAGPDVSWLLCDLLRERFCNETSKVENCALDFGRADVHTPLGRGKVPVGPANS